MKQHLINFFLDYFNNYLTVTKMAEDYGITKDECDQLIEIGRKYHYETTKTMSKGRPKAY